MQLVGIPTLIVGLILRYADNPPWFASAHNVGHILILASVIWLAFWTLVLVVVFLIGLLSTGSSYSRARRRRTRGRRGF